MRKILLSFGDRQAGKTLSPLPAVLNANMYLEGEVVILRLKRKDQENYRDTGPGVTYPLKQCHQPQG